MTTTIEPVAVARLSRTMIDHGYAANEAFARAGSLLAAHAEMQAERQPERYSMSYAPPQECHQQNGTATVEPDDHDRALFLFHLRKRGLGNFATAPAGQTLPELPTDYAATPEDDQVFDKLLRHYSLDRLTRQPARASATPAQPAPGVLPGAPTTEPEQFSREDMQRALRHQNENPGSTFEQSAAAIRNGATRRYTADEFRDMLLRASPLTKESMDAAHKYQAVHPGTSFRDACLATAHEGPQRYALERSGTHVIDPGDVYTGDQAGALEWSRQRTNEHRDSLETEKRQRYAASDLSRKTGMPYSMCRDAMEQADTGEASTPEQALERMAAAERNRREFAHA